MQLAQPLATTLKTRSGYQVSIPGGTDDVLIQLNNVDVLRITLGANMTIKAQGDLTLEANNIKLNSMNDVKVKAGNTMDMRASASASIRAGSNLTLDGPSGVNVNQGALEVS
jgi:uncharacterized protein (DUF2345 family)